MSTRKAAVNACILLILVLAAPPGTAQAQFAACPSTSQQGVYLYSSDRYLGRCAFFSISSNASIKTIRHPLAQSTVGDNAASSIRILGNYRVTLYIDSDFEGTHSTFVGDDLDFGDDEVRHNRASSIIVQLLPGVCARGDGVFIFEKSSCAGRATQITEDVANLTGSNIGNNLASSVSVGGEFAVTLYQFSDYRGEQSTFVSSDVNFDNNDIGHDRASAVRFRESRCDDAPGVYVYSASGGGGRCSKFRRDTDSLHVEYVLGDQASSIRMIGDWVATLYQHGAYRGTSTTFTGEDLTFGDNAIGHDRASSIRVRSHNVICTGEPGVYLYESPGFAGRCSRFTDDSSNISNTDVGEETASSIRLVGDYQARVYQDRDFRGSSSFFDADDADFSGDAVQPNRASSIDIFGPGPEQQPVYRVQVRLFTADVEDAGTDDDVVVSLNPANATWLDSPGDDFERGRNRRYDLFPNGVSRFDDIDWLTITKTGSDGWCISRIELLVNNPADAVFSRTFGPCRWLDNDGGHTRNLRISHTELRQGSDWDDYGQSPLSLNMEASEVISRVETAVGNTLHFNDRGYWGNFYGAAVEIRPEPDLDRVDVLHAILDVDLDLAGDATGLPDPEIDVDFELHFTCDPAAEPGVIVISLENIDVTTDFSNWVEWFTFFVEGRISDEIEDAVGSWQTRIDTGQGRCPSWIRVESDGEVVIVP